MSENFCEMNYCDPEDMGHYEDLEGEYEVDERVCTEMYNEFRKYCKNYQLANGDDFVIRVGGGCTSLEPEEVHKFSYNNFAEVVCLNRGEFSSWWGDREDPYYFECKMEQGHFEVHTKQN